MGKDNADGEDNQNANDFCAGIQTIDERIALFVKFKLH